MRTKALILAGILLFVGSFCLSTLGVPQMVFAAFSRPAQAMTLTPVNKPVVAKDEPPLVLASYSD